MTRLTIVAAIGVLSVTSPLPAMAGSEPAGHKHETEVFSAGDCFANDAWQTYDNNPCG